MFPWDKTSSKNIKFVIIFLEFTFNTGNHIEIKLYILGSSYILKRAGRSKRKNIEVRYHYIRDKVKEKDVEIIYVRYEENCCRWIQNNLGQYSFDKNQNYIEDMK